MSVAYAHFATSRPVIAPADWQAFDRFIEMARLLVDEAGFATLSAQGQATALEEAVDAALLRG